MSDQKHKELPKYWVTRVSRSRKGKVYYFNTKTQESVWKISHIKESKISEVKNDGPEKKLGTLRKVQSASKSFLAFFSIFFLKVLTFS